MSVKVTYQNREVLNCTLQIQTLYIWMQDSNKRSMGLFSIFFSVVIVIIQATSLLLQRDAHKWTFSLVKNEPNISHFKDIHDTMLVYNTKLPLITRLANYSDHIPNEQLSVNLLEMKMMSLNNTSLNSTSKYYATGKQLACIQMHWRDKPALDKIPVHCFFNTHFNQIIEPILKPINPHIILFVICCINAIFCLSKLKSKADLKSKETTAIENDWSIEPAVPFYMSLNYVSGILLLLVFVVFVIHGVEDIEFVEYPTIILSLMLILFTIWYVMKIQTYKEDTEWINAFHMQSTAVPLATLTLGTLGTRVWSDLFLHFCLLNAAVNILWLENHFTHITSKKVCQFLSITLPIFSLYLAHLQWGKFDNWKYAITIMSFICFLPFLLYLLITTSDGGKNLKAYGKMTTFFISSALITVVINFAVFEESK